MGRWQLRYAHGLSPLAGAVLCLALVEPVCGQGTRTQSPAAACRFEPAGIAKVANVLDGRSFVLDDGREVRLAGIEVPPVPRPGETGPRARAGAVARGALEAMLADRQVEIGRGPTDRYGRTIAYVNVVVDGGRLPVSHAMVAGGHARVAAQLEPAGCATELLGYEREARTAKLGLWADPYYAMLEAGSGAALLAERGHFTLVEGRVLSVRESGSIIYLNFGRRWSDALTVTISKRNERMFTAAGMTPKRLEHRRLRVRGWIEERNGPQIEVTRPEQIEIAERN
jgi:endonuclease YncB( thermonuclease family)